MPSFYSDDAFRRRMRPKAEGIYKHIFPECSIRDLRPDGEQGAHTLDQHFGIDTILELSSGCQVSVQEKFRRHEALTDRGKRVDYVSPDFTQELKNAAGTDKEEPGEWSHLNADYYFYGWANAEETAFAAWAFINVPTYKVIIEYHGGFDGFGFHQQNRSHGKASFYAFPIMMLEPAFLESYIPDEYTPGYPKDKFWEDPL